ncbi:nuclear transport factor 2 family protein [Sphingobium sufflavum]|uniref:nuclear transport factor 2 family protein n=1 Tax=Sphingobium sufflavum TaxID=1129547 RepID=UPI001F2C3E40|nr:nuclear transport factor 2 family protein [Sphingobium sufflavum]MCE7798600.1 nuclear transport factor 2 family protein [Sphingobium sufflavum]
MMIEELLAREAIRKTMAAYTTAGDRLKEDAFIACFTADAVMEAVGLNADDGFRYDGREAIRQWIGRWRGGGDVAPTHGARFVRHHLSTCQIELTGPDSARARTYWVAWTDIGPDHAGHYLDDFRREGDDWLIAYRRIREDWRADGSLFKGAVANSR